jgi:hypothetical protein
LIGSSSDFSDGYVCAVFTGEKGKKREKDIEREREREREGERRERENIKLHTHKQSWLPRTENFQ